MEVAEFIELTVATREGIGGHVGNFIAVLFAYLIMTYLVGEKLSRFQVWGLSAIYSAYQFLPANATLADIRTLGALASEFHRQHPADAALYSSQGQAYPELFAAIAFISWILSLAFMAQQRRKGNKVADA